MSGTIPERERYTPLVLTETGSLTREQWLDCRRQGIGGSDAAAIMGISPFRTLDESTAMPVLCHCTLQPRLFSRLTMA